MIQIELVPNGFKGHIPKNYYLFNIPESNDEYDTFIRLLGIIYSGMI